MMRTIGVPISHHPFTKKRRRPYVTQRGIYTTLLKVFTHAQEGKLFAAFSPSQGAPYKGWKTTDFRDLLNFNNSCYQVSGFSLTLVLNYPKII